MQDSAARLKGGCGYSAVFGQEFFPVFYHHGVGYLLAGDSTYLFQVRMLQTNNTITLDGKKISSDITQKAFEKQFKQYKGSKATVERVPGIKETAYTVYDGGNTGPSYRIFFREGKLQVLLLYIPCA